MANTGNLKEVEPQEESKTEQPGPQSTPESQSLPWSNEEMALLQKAVARFPGGTQQYALRFSNL
jgi:hypothetical protein